MIENHSYFKLPDDPSTKVWRYMSFTKFVALLHSSSLYFCRADQFEDPFEGTVPEQTRVLAEELFSEKFDNPQEMAEQIIHLYEQMRLFTFVNCWHMNDAESDAMWKLYSLAGEGVAIQSTVGRLRQCLDTAPQKIHLGTIQYVDFDKAEPALFMNGLTPYIFKRKSFEHERELRAFIWFNTGLPEPTEEEGVLLEPTSFGENVNVDLNTLIENIVVSPLAPKWFYELVKSLIEKFNVNCPMIPSPLYLKPERRLIHTPTESTHKFEITQAMIDHLHQQHLQYIEIEQKQKERLAARQYDAIMDWYREIEKTIEAASYTLPDGTILQGKNSFKSLAQEIIKSDVSDIRSHSMFHTIFLLTGRFDNLFHEILNSIIMNGEKSLLLKKMFFLYSEILTPIFVGVFLKPQNQEAQIDESNDNEFGDSMGILYKNFVKFLSFMEENGI